jgi:hypothetical protein
MMSITKVRALAGHAADATSETMTSTLFHSEVRGVAVRAGADARWLREPDQSARISRAWSMGESVWMVAQQIIWTWEGRQLAARDVEGHVAIRAAWRKRQEIG